MSATSGITGPGAYDLITSSSSLQWMQPLDELFCRLNSMLEAGRSAPLLAHGRRNARRASPPAQGDRSAQDPAPTSPYCCRDGRVPRTRTGSGFLVPAGYPTDAVRQFRGPFRTIRELGFTGGPLGTSSPLLTRGELKRLAERYTVECALPGGQVGASYVIYSFEAVKTVTS